MCKLCVQTNSVSKSDPPTNQSGISRALSHFLDNFCQVCKFKAIRLGLCSTPHILSLNKIIHDSVIWGLNETALSYCSCKSTRSLLAYAALVLNTLALTTWMKLISQMLEETVTKMSHFLTSKLEFPKVKLNINMSLDKNSSIMTLMANINKNPSLFIPAKLHLLWNQTQPFFYLNFITQYGMFIYSPLLKLYLQHCNSH